MKSASYSVLKNFQLRSKSFRLYWVLLLLVLTLAIPTIFLRGTLQQNTVLQTNGLNNFATLEGVSVGPTIWNEGFANLTAWSLSGSAPAILQLNNSLVLSVAFSSKPVAQAVSATRSVSLSLDQNPIVTITLRVTRGVSYGIRFFGVTSNNASFAAWKEGDSLQHRLGLGTSETISANLVLEFYLANQKAPLPGSRITKIVFYIEAAALTSGNFAMTVTKLQANSVLETKATSMEVNGNFTGVIADLGPAIANQGLFQVFVGLDIEGTSGLTYVPYLTSGASVVAQGFVYSTKVATTYELALLQPSFVNSSPLFLGKPTSSSLIVSAKAGVINFFRLDSISIRYLTAPSAAGQLLNPANYQLLAYYYIVFLFVVPIAMTLLLVKVFRDEE
jgi:hypothetical protein